MFILSSSIFSFFQSSKQTHLCFKERGRGRDMRAYLINKKKLYKNNEPQNGPKNKNNLRTTLRTFSLFFTKLLQYYFNI